MAYDASEESRAIEMLKIAAKYIRKYWTDGTIFYDGTTCDGYCVADDCESAADELKLKAKR